MLFFNFQNIIFWYCFQNQKKTNLISQQQTTALVQLMSTYKVKSPNSAPAAYKYSPLWFHLGNTVSFAMCAMFIFLVPFSRSGELFYPSAIYDLLFTEKLADYAHFKQAMPMNSFIGPALITSATRLITTVFDTRLRALILNKLSGRFSELADPSLHLHLVDTHFFSLIVARMVICLGFVAAFAFLRHQVALKYKSALPARLLTLFICAGTYCAYSASRLHSQTFSLVLYVVALGFLVQGQLNRAFSCLAVNAAIFDGIFGSAVLFAAIPAFLLGRSSGKGGKAMASAIISFVAAAFISFLFDSILYNKFIWPQGEVIMTFLQDLKLPILRAPETVTCAVLAVLSGVVALVLRGDSAFASSLALTQSISVALAPFCGRSLISLEFVPLSWCTIFAFRTTADFKSRSLVRKAFGTATILAAFALPWMLVPFITKTAGESQYGAAALMALNVKVVEATKAGNVVRVHLDRKAREHGYSSFLQVNHANALYSTSLSASDVTNFRPDYLLRSVKYCTSGKAMKTFRGFEKFKLNAGYPIRSLVDLKNLNPEFVQADRLAVFRASQCEIADFEQGKNEVPPSGPSATGKLVSKFVFGGQLERVGEQRVFIAEKTGSFSHKKIANMIGIVAYLYTTILEQI